MKLITVLLGLGGLYLMGMHNWEIALGAFLFTWSNNVQQSMIGDINGTRKS